MFCVFFSFFSKLLLVIDNRTLFISGDSRVHRGLLGEDRLHTSTGWHPNRFVRSAAADLVARSGWAKGYGCLTLPDTRARRHTLHRHLVKFEFFAVRTAVLQRWYHHPPPFPTHRRGPHYLSNHNTSVRFLRHRSIDEICEPRGTRDPAGMGARKCEYSGNGKAKGSPKEFWACRAKIIQISSMNTVIQRFRLP